MALEVLVDVLATCPSVAERFAESAFPWASSLLGHARARVRETAALLVGYMAQVGPQEDVQAWHQQCWTRLQQQLPDTNDPARAHGDALALAYLLAWAPAPLALAEWPAFLHQSLAPSCHDLLRLGAVQV